MSKYINTSKRMWCICRNYDHKRCRNHTFLRLYNQCFKDKATKQSKKYYPGCPFILRSISTEMNVMCIVKIIFWGNNSQYPWKLCLSYRGKKKKWINLHLFLCLFKYKDNYFVMWLLEMFTVSLVTIRSSGI